MIFIDEIDSICRQRNSREEEHTRRVKTELLKQMEGADNSESADQIFLLCATNCPWELDTAFLRRFQKRIYIPLPGMYVYFFYHTLVFIFYRMKWLLQTALIALSSVFTIDRFNNSVIIFHIKLIIYITSMRPWCGLKLLLNSFLTWVS